MRATWTRSGRRATKYRLINQNHVKLSPAGASLSGSAKFWYHFEHERTYQHMQPPLDASQSQPRHRVPKYSTHRRSSIDKSSSASVLRALMLRSHCRTAHDGIQIGALPRPDQAGSVGRSHVAAHGQAYAGPVGRSAASLHALLALLLTARASLHAPTGNNKESAKVLREVLNAQRRPQLRHVKRAKRQECDRALAGR